MKQLFLIIISTILISLSSCDNENSACFKSSGEEKVYSQSLNSFTEININSNFIVILNQSNNYGIKIRAGKNLIPYVKYEVVGNRLNIENNNRCNWLRDYEKIEIEISFPNLRFININEPIDLLGKDTLKLNNISIDNRAGILRTDLHIECDSIWFRSHAATGDFNFRGLADYAYIYNVGNGYLHAGNFKCKTMHIVHRSLGNSIINVTDLLMIEDIQHGKVELRFNCPYIDYNNKDYGTLFENIGCL